MPPSHAQLIVRGFLALYLVVVGFIVFLPGGDAQHVTGIVAILARALEAAGAFGVPFEVGYVIVEFLANIALFVPFGILLSIVAPLSPRWLVISCGFALSAAIEFVQTMLPTRYPTVSDVIANTLGTALGVALLTVWVAWRRRRGPKAKLRAS